MKIVCVSGGNYKSFYLNYFIKLRQCDLLLFNFGIIYDYVVSEELLKNAIVTKELMFLSKKLNAMVVAGVFVNNNNERIKSIIVCDGDKIHLNNIKKGAKISFKNITFIVGDENTNYLHYNKIVFSKNKIIPNLNNCSKRKIYLFCDKSGVSLVQKGEFERKFNKYSKFILK